MNAGTTDTIGRDVDCSTSKTVENNSITWRYGVEKSIAFSKPPLSLTLRRPTVA